MKVVFDTNVFVSAFIVPGRQSEDAFLLAQRRAVDLYGSVPILTEAARVFRTKFNQPEKDITAVLKLISRAAIIVRPVRTITVFDDQPDNRILECAAAAGGYHRHRRSSSAQAQSIRRHRDCESGRFLADDPFPIKSVHAAKSPIIRPSPKDRPPWPMLDCKT